MNTRRLSQQVTLVILTLVLTFASGCDYYTDVVWLPDSSGFCYTTPKRRLVRFDVATGKRHVLVADTGTLTTRPAVSPDGKRLAVARLAGKSKKREGIVLVDRDTVEIVVYDVDGKELHRSPELVWRKEGQYGEWAQLGPEGHTRLLWGPKGKEDKLAIFEAPGDWGLYDLKTKRLIVPTDALLAIRPDNSGFLVVSDGSPQSIAFVDFEGNKHPITMKEGQLDQKGLKRGWEGHTFVGWWVDNLLRIDTEKWVGVFEHEPRTDDEPKEGVRGEPFSFPDKGAIVRVICQDEKQDGLSLSRLEVVQPGEKKPIVVIANTPQWLSLNPAPDKKLVAVRTTTLLLPGDEKKKMPDKILLLNSEGKVVKEIVESED
jgi:hypothetical protein